MPLPAGSASVTTASRHGGLKGSIVDASFALLVLFGLLAIMTGIEFSTTARTSAPSRAVAVLVIESDERLRHDLSAFIRRRGHDVWAVATADAAVRLSRHQPPDVVLMDEAALPAARYFRLAGNSPVMILMAATLDQGQRQQARALAIQGILRKPVQADALAALLDRRRLA